ncbi:spermidine synthase [Egicoccus halophilus]|uniref:Spermidine synthase n=1 Tax=Egicoccus halophilus TaxID=1670830 RepID=A0A8J3ABS7_9ACTN|nr:spermidine synthase [Egicoccus halophilus]GGI07818.1 spermidine synthase [Egicoccus halophilus]
MPLFEQLDAASTPMGPISLRRRRELTLDVDVFEVKLGDEFLMSSLFPVAEIELARLGLGAVEGRRLDVVVGGLGLGYTARTVLEDERVASLTVVEALPQVVSWHERQLLPEVAGLASDPRTRLLTADFFALVRDAAGFAPGRPEDRVDAVLLDIDHTPRHVLHPSHASFYARDGLRQLLRSLRPGGVFALWSDDPPDEPFLADLRAVFDDATAEVVDFPNPLIGGRSANTVYVARVGDGR